jgi:RNA polymerase sigma factor (sigma-70 family)
MIRTDGEIFARSVRDPGAFREIFERHGAAVLGYARKRIGQAGEEIAARTFLTAFERRARFDTSYRSARPWLLGIATNLIRHHLREEQDHLGALRRLAEERPVPVDDPTERLDAARMRPLLLAALSELSSKDRETFLLVAVGELTYEETAAILEVPIGTVRSRIHRARTKVRERVQHEPAIQDEHLDPAEGRPWTSST